MNGVISVFHEAFSLERINPLKAYRLFLQFQREYRYYDWPLFVLGIVLPVPCFLGARYLHHHTGLSDILITFLVWFCMGFYPLHVLGLRKMNIDWERRRRVWKALGSSDFSYRLNEIFTTLLWFLSGTIIYWISGFVASIFLGGLLILAGLVYHLNTGIPTRDAVEILFQRLNLTVVGVFYILVFLVLASDVQFRYIFSLPKLYWGLKSKGRNLVYLTYMMLLMFILGGGSMGMFYDRLLLGISLSFVTGLLGSYSSTIHPRDHVLDALFEIAKVRCLFRLGERFKAEMLLDNFETINKWQKFPSYVPQFMQFLGSSQKVRGKEAIRSQLESRCHPPQDHYISVFLYSRENTKHLFGFPCLTVPQIEASVAHSMTLIDLGMIKNLRVLKSVLQYDRRERMDYFTSASLFDLPAVLRGKIPRSLWLASMAAYGLSAVGILTCIIAIAITIIEVLASGYSGELLTDAGLCLLVGLGFIVLAFLLLMLLVVGKKE